MINKKNKIPNLLKFIDINTYIAIKKHYSDSVNCKPHSFYAMIKRRIEFKKVNELALNLKYELLHHIKEVAQYQ